MGFVENIILFLKVTLDKVITDYVMSCFLWATV